MIPSRARQTLLACASGLLYPLCFPNLDLGFLAWVVLVPLHLALEDASPKQAFWLGWLTGLIGSTGVLYWVITVMHLYGKVPLPIAVALMLLLTTYVGLFVAMYSIGFIWLRRTFPTLIVLAAPCLWVSLEWMRTHLFAGFPWGLLGYSQYQWLPVIQIVDRTGVYGLSFLVTLVNVGLTTTVLWLVARLSGLRPKRFAWHEPAAALAGLVVTLVYGHLTLSQATPADSSRTVQIGVVQPNIDQTQKWDVAYRRETLDRLTRLTMQVSSATDLILWPEAAAPFVFEMEPEYRQELSALAQKAGAPILFGSPTLRRQADGRPYLLNSAYLLSPDGQVLGRYDKQHLVPFGEYIPLKTSLLFFLDKLVEGIGDFQAGPGPTLLSFTPRSQTVGAADGLRRQARFGVVICYEVIFPNLVREFAADGADFLVTITNDAWFGRSSAAAQHFGMVVLRSVENHLAFARAANTGISGFIDPYGRIVQATPIFTEEALVGRVPLSRMRTFYSRHGDVFAYGCVILTALLCLVGYFSRRTGPTSRTEVSTPA